MNSIGERIKHLRESKKDIDNKWTQQYVAERIGVARVTYTGYEVGSKTPPPDIVVKMATLFNVTTDYILGHSDDPNKTKDEELEEFINNVRVWYKDEPKDKEERLEMMKKMFEVFKDK